MFVRYYVTIPKPIEECREAMVREPSSWLPQIVADAETPAGPILARLGFSLVRKQAVVSVGEPVSVGDWLHVPIEWHASPAAGLFPAFNGEIQLVPIDPDVTKVAVAGTYDPPAGDVGRAVDNLLLHTAAEATVKDFAEGVARRIARGVSTKRAASGA